VTDVDFDDDGNRLLKSVDLWEVSLVSLAMNPLARVEAMKAAQLSPLGEWVPTQREFEQRLRDAGCSRKVARQIIARLGTEDDETPPRGMLDGFARRDAGQVEDDETALLKSLECLTGKMVRAAFQR
jgi:hypothetical protein